METPDTATEPVIHGREFFLLSFFGHTFTVFLHFAYLWLDDLVRMETGTLWPRLIEELTGGYGAFAWSWVVFLVWRRVPLSGPWFLRRLPAYLGLGVLLSIGNTSFMWASRSLIFPLVGLGAYDYGRMPLRYLMELPASLIGYAILLATLIIYTEVQLRRHRERTQAALAQALVASQLQNLQLQLQPHFLFNALNTISAKLHESPAVADELLGRLAELLRASLRTSSAQRLPVQDEVTLLHAYIELMQARFGDRLTISVHVELGTEALLVPPLLLQPLIENAVRHGGLEQRGHAVIRVAIASHHSQLTLSVRDDGPGIASGRDAFTSGTGLSTTARRLALLYGANAHVQAGNGDDGGFVVTVTLPAEGR